MFKKIVTGLFALLLSLGLAGTWAGQAGAAPFPKPTPVKIKCAACNAQVLSNTADITLILQKEWVKQYVFPPTVKVVKNVSTEPFVDDLVEVGVTKPVPGSYQARDEKTYVVKYKATGLPANKRIEVKVEGKNVWYFSGQPSFTVRPTKSGNITLPGRVSVTLTQFKPLPVN